MSYSDLELKDTGTKVKLQELHSIMMVRLLKEMGLESDDLAPLGITDIKLNRNDTDTLIDMLCELSAHNKMMEETLIENGISIPDPPSNSKENLHYAPNLKGT